MPERTKHIVFVNHTRELHGSEQVMLATMRLCKSQGWRLTIVLPSNKPEGGLEAAIMDTAEILYLNYKNSGEGWLRTLAVEIYNLPARIRLCRWLRNNKADVIYSNTSVTMLGVKAARWTQTPHIWHWHELPTEEFGWSKKSVRLLRYWAIHSTRLLFIAKTQKELWEKKLGGVQFSNARIVYNPVREIRAVNAVHEGSVRIGYVGSFMDRKNLPWLVQTAAELAKEYKLHLCLYGAQNQQEAAEMQALWPDDEQFSVHAFTEDIASVYSGLDIFVLPSWSETMPLVVLEAMQAGVCVIQTCCSGMKEIMHDGEECLFVDPHTKESLRNALIRCMDASYRERIAARGRCFAEEWVKQNEYKRNILSVFNGIISKNV